MVSSSNVFFPQYFLAFLFLLLTLPFKIKFKVFFFFFFVQKVEHQEKNPNDVTHLLSRGINKPRPRVGVEKLHNDDY
ncbi:hypothetical protein L3Y34_004609 [Caenorhabditis briggsae]|uniref:Uncharacterized protein n=1 Tax=Caenorhabditis briggsae TaxID=6238 RepID=A0AAE9AFQ5_CAEBR|nr:hypothetical protein L3Y34_004609 [Caenorhabditis briggsae]